MYKRTLAFLLTLCMILGMFPVTALAAESNYTGTFQMTYINPLYADVVTEDDLNKSDTAPSTYSLVRDDVEYSTSIDEAGAVMRGRMEDRMESFTINYATDDFDPAEAKQLMQDIFYKAVKHTGEPTQGDYLMWQHAGWTCTGGYFQEGDYYYIELIYELTYYTDYDQEQLVDEKVDVLLDELIVSGMTDYQKVKAAYDWICSNVTYDYDNLYDDSYNLKYTAYAALIDNTAVCQGYALLMYRMMLEMGIDCRLIAGEGNGEAHGWNIVELSDLYYNADSTWDAETTDYSWFLLSEESFTNHVRYGATDYNPTDYTSDSFYADYPMADSDYAPTEADLTPPSGDNEVPNPTDPTDPEPTDPEPTDPEPTDPAPGGVIASGSCGDDVTWSLSGDYVLTLSGTGEMDVFDTEGPPWYEYAELITDVVVKDGITTLGDLAFWDCVKLTSVTLPDSITDLGWDTFDGCKNLTDVKLPANITILGSTFGGCTSLKTVDIPENVTRLSGTFSGCTALTSITLPESVEEIGDSSFARCSALTEIVLPDAVEEIGDCTFEDCTAMERITFSEDLEAIGDYAFSGCTALKSITLSEDLVEIGEYAFSGCTGLESVEIPKNVSRIGQFAFNDCESLTAVKFMGDAPQFGGSVFSGVTATCYYPEGNETWTEEKMVDHGGTLTWVAYERELVADGTCGENVTWHYDQETNTLTISGTGDMYDYSTNEPPYWIEDEYPVAKVVVESGVTSIGSAAFNSMAGLTEVTLADTIKSIGNMTFTMCQALKTVKLSEGITSIGEFAFDGCTSLTGIVLPESLTTVGMYAFHNTAITSVAIPAGVTRFYDYTFADCTSLEEVTFQEGLVYAGDGTFNGCSALTSITFPSTVTGIGMDFFMDCTSLETVYFLGDAPDFSSGVFANVTTTCFYPAGNATWTSAVMQDYDGTVTWTAYCPGGCDYETVVTEPTCTEPGITTHTCSNCGGSYTENPVDALGHYYEEGVCSRCGAVEGELASPVVTAENIPETGKIKLSWAAVQGAEEYNIYRSTNQYDIDTYVLLDTITETSFEDTTAAAGTTYYYCVTSLSADGTESELPQDYIVECTCDLAQPVLTLSNAASSGKIKIKWNAVEGAKEYKLYRSSTGKDGSFTRISTTTGTSVTNTKNIEPGVTYYYKVIAIAENTDANSAYSAVKSRICKLARPELTVGNVASSGKIKITWEAVEGAKEYKLYRSLTGEDGSFTRISTTTGTSVTNTKNIEPGVTYYYKVIAIAENTDANSVYSAVKARTCDLARPELTVGNVASSGKIKITWEAVEGAKEYKLYRSLTGKDGSFTRISTTTGTSVTNTKNTEPGVTYYYKVIAIAEDTAANSAYSAVKARTCDLARPTVKVTNVASTGKIRITWDAVEGAVKYKVYRSLTGKDGSFTRISTTTGTRVTNTKNTEPGVTYYYKVIAIAEDTAANSAYSAVKSCVCKLARPEVTIGLNSAGQPLLDWEQVEGAVAYEIYHDTYADGSFDELIETTTDTTYTHSGAGRSDTHYYRVVAVAEDTAANSVESKMVFTCCTTEDIRPSKISKDVVELINEYRVEAGLNELEWYTEGETPARVRVSELARKFDYYRPYGEDPETIWNGYDIYSECRAQGFSSASAVVEAMMEDKDAAEICLYEDWTHAVAARYDDCWVIAFGF